VGRLDVVLFEDELLLLLASEVPKVEVHVPRDTIVDGCRRW
jgi:hypothetical protein